MKTDKVNRLLWGLIALAAVMFAFVFPQKSHAAIADMLAKEVFKYPPHVVIQEGNALWQLWYMQHGTRSQGIHGRLYIDGQEVVGISLDEEKEVERKVFVWYGLFAERKYVWDWSGWLPKDISPEKLKKSQYTTRAGWLILSGQNNQVSIREKDGDIFCRLGKVYKSDPVYYELCLNGIWLGKGRDGEVIKSAFGEHEFMENTATWSAGWVLTE